jgi:hypothetical protein
VPFDGLRAEETAPWGGQDHASITGGRHAAPPPRPPVWAIAHVTVLRLGHPLAWTLAQIFSVAIGRTAGLDAGFGVPAAVTSTAD